MKTYGAFGEKNGKHPFTQIEQVAVRLSNAADTVKHNQDNTGHDRQNQQDIK